MLHSLKKYLIEEFNCNSILKIRCINYFGVCINTTVSIDQSRVYSINFTDVIAYRYVNSRLSTYFEMGVYTISHEEYLKIFRLETSGNTRSPIIDIAIEYKHGLICYVIAAHNALLTVLTENIFLAEPIIFIT